MAATTSSCLACPCAWSRARWSTWTEPSTAGSSNSDSPSHSVAGNSISYAGRTWHGVLAGKVLCPPEGSSHYTASGEANAAIAAMLAACPVGEPFAVSNADSGLTVPATRMPRYCTLYEALRRAMRAAGARLSIAATQAGVELAAVGVRDWGDAMEPGRASFSATRVHRPVNHLVVLGKGEMEARRVVHLYADVSGRVSGTQTLFGVDERAEVYELSSEEGAELESKAHEKLEVASASTPPRPTSSSGRAWLWATG